MLNRKEVGLFFKKPETIEFQGRKLKLWSRNYWIIQPFLVSFGYPLYFSKIKLKGWENIPQDKPVIFAISHRNAFMDSLAFVNQKNTQVWQLARGDAWKGKFLTYVFDIFHMLPIWRESDGENIDTKLKNEPTFNACYDLLAKNAMIGIYPEGNCINEEHIRPLKKGICRIAFGAMEKYNFDIDIQIIPVGISYTGAEKFKKWQFMNVGQPISVKKYEEQYKHNPGQAILHLKEEIEAGMRETVVHIKKGPFQKDIERIAQMTARDFIISNRMKFDPESKVYKEKEMVAKLERVAHEQPGEMQQLADEYQAYEKLRNEHRFRENTFDKQKHSTLASVFMFLYFIAFFPFMLFGAIVNYLPYKFIPTFIEQKVKQKIFWSSGKYVVGLFLFPLWYLILALIVYSLLGSALSALIFLVAFPITGHIAYYYLIDLKKWFSVLRFKRMDKSNRALLTTQREIIIKKVNSI